MRLSQWSRAVPLLQRVVQLDPEDAFAWYELTTCRLRLGLLNDALESAKQYTELPGYRVKGLFLQAGVQNDMNNLEIAANLHREILRISPDANGLMIPQGDFFLQFGAMLGSIGRNEEALAILERAVQSNPFPHVYVILGNAHRAAGDVDAAVGAWRYVLTLEPANLRARESLARVCLEDGRTAEGLQLLQGIDLETKLNSSTAYLLQRLYVVHGDEAKANEWEQRTATLRKEEERYNAITQYLVRSPQSYWASVIRVYRFAQDQNWSQAKDMLREVMEIDDTDPFVQKLITAVNERGPLPPIDELPIRHF
jgi:tetratricopeptide (TPR) repeat protein